MRLARQAVVGSADLGRRSVGRNPEALVVRGDHPRLIGGDIDGP